MAKKHHSHSPGSKLGDMPSSRFVIKTYYLLTFLFMQNLYAHMPRLVSKHVQNLINILVKAKDFAGSKGLSEAELLNLRIAPDMFPLMKQIQVVSDSSKGIVARLAGVDAPVMEDTEVTIDDCIARLEKTLRFIESIDPATFASADSRKQIVGYIPGKYQDTVDFTLDMAIPNFFFHFTTAYNLLRGAGMEIGKMDYIGQLNLHDLT